VSQGLLVCGHGTVEVVEELTNSAWFLSVCCLVWYCDGMLLTVPVRLTNLDPGAFVHLLQRGLNSGRRLRNVAIWLMARRRAVVERHGAGGRRVWMGGHDD
jgi:hypothetical protein